ncbi:2',3'-cyclic-nucleotide 2'-phosphodiesterase/5'-or 3'-nucleotidase, 5'-nucleotidase family [Halorubrum ezzemoulense]|uniref:2',3'-cyclic-nucleotide 2'-phosphodiesterase/5'-or 3'-nucleotidase, 5'-nucleotidase family n=1 Tax=Halorubrum ezzemoulense TaxID=337243 RepID=A0A238XCW3_HALEZ|nr:MULTISPECIES: 5'-nucleotidase C-terminal domain-containing protein [Halorubrum]TKX39725.1 bifunctional metallophosphatase/5'-nucleotidase [Halorubrum sp. CGM4_25_10-8A]TKX64665.1 bifunctional metallophosphatase/5'-nucleotidase [Halorubrum sp. GN12_10-3_MGM]SNR56482.1 2',3'-cyclic-nucleotide 2'-phosphodiesterase/5'-or 3'-nucleotidase, 5'-nucleotidase family [Halorubrum ezzemoulense]
MVRLVHYSDIENVFDAPERAARLAGRIRALSGPDAAVVGTGDTTAPGVLSLVATGRQVLDFYEVTDTALDTFGNHEFDYGPDPLRGLVADSPATFVSANVRGEAGEPFGRDEGVVPWATREVDGETVGFVGVTDPATDSLNPMAADLSFDDPVSAARDALAEMRAAVAERERGGGGDEGLNHVVVLSHLGAGDDDLARELDVDAVAGGHVHSRRNEVVDDTLLVRPGVNGEAVAEIDLDSEPPAATLHEPDGADPAPGLADALAERMAAADLDETVDTVDRPIERSGDVVHGGECRVGNFVADAFRWVHDADVGLSNAGGLRQGDPWTGDVTKADLISLIPFEEPVALASVTGAELSDVFREMAAPDVDFGEDDWWHGHVSNARVVWDDDAELVLEATVGGEPIDPDARYTVAVSEYLLHSEHEYPTLGQRHRVDEADIQYEVLAAYAREHGIAPEIEGRIEIRNRAPAADDD